MPTPPAPPPLLLLLLLLLVLKPPPEEKVEEEEAEEAEESMDACAHTMDNVSAVSSAARTSSASASELLVETDDALVEVA